MSQNKKDNTIVKRRCKRIWINLFFCKKERFFVFYAAFDNVTERCKLTRESAFAGVFFISNKFVMINV